jgi:hypothetical protein
MSSVLINQQYILNMAPLNRNNYKTRLHIDGWTNTWEEAQETDSTFPLGAMAQYSLIQCLAELCWVELANNGNWLWRRKVGHEGPRCVTLWHSRVPRDLQSPWATKKALLCQVLMSKGRSPGPRPLTQGRQEIFHSDLCTRRLHN